MTTRTLLLLRHAKAEPTAATDHSRPLAIRGRRQSTGVGDDLAARGPLPDLALVSTATRTTQTYELVAARLPQPPQVRRLEDLYDASPRSALAVLREEGGDAETLLVVGHEPVMSSLAALLANGESDPALVDVVRHGIPTATRVELEVTGEWADLDRGTARLVAVLRAPQDS